MKHKFNFDYVKEQIRKALNEVVKPESDNKERQDYYDWVREYNRKLIEEQRRTLSDYITEPTEEDEEYAESMFNF